MSLIKCNLHTHTRFCDGKDSMETMVQAAMEKGFETLGFSPHSYTPFCLDYCVRDFGKEAEEFNRLKSLYGDKICLLNGIELDNYGEKPSDVPLDFVIGSVHYVKGDDGELYAVDESAEDFALAVNQGFGGDADLFARRYYDTLADMAVRVKPDIIGHFDIVDLFGKYPSEDNLYVNAAYDACDAVKQSGALVEVNSGRLFKGLGGLYPADFILKRLITLGVDFILSSDAHRAEALGYEFDATTRKLKEMGVKRLAVFDKDGKKFVTL